MGLFEIIFEELIRRYYCLRDDEEEDDFEGGRKLKFLVIFVVDELVEKLEEVLLVC